MRSLLISYAFWTLHVTNSTMSTSTKGPSPCESSTLAIQWGKSTSLHIQICLSSSFVVLKYANTNPNSVTADIEGVKGKIIVGAKYGYALMDRETGKLNYLKRIWDESDGPTKPKRMRFNDGAVDPRGRFWCGAMTDPVFAPKFKREGVLFRLDPDLSLHRMISPVVIPNGLFWSKDEKTMFFTDTATMEIAAYDYNVETGDIDINSRRVFWKYEGAGGPDGWAMDEDENIWHAIYDGSKVLRISKEGKVTGEIQLPCKAPTCLRFVGTEVYITSAANDDDSEFAGSLFKVDVGIRGREYYEFKGQNIQARL
jgi:sugar lactone lactonase YvrE